MKQLTHKTIYAALLGIALAGAPLAAFAQEGPRPSSLNNWPGMVDQTSLAYGAATPAYGAPSYSPTAPGTWSNFPASAAPLSSANPVFDGPRPSPNY